MAVKFLPFVTDKSSPESIFKALVQRSKGVSNKQLSAIYCALLGAGVETVKEYASQLPPHYSSNEVFEALSNHYIDYCAPADQINFLSFILNFYGIEKLENYNKYSKKEYAVMFSGIFSYRPEMIKDTGFAYDLGDEINKFLSFETAPEIENLEHTSFNRNEGVRVGFCHRTEFLAFVAYIENISKQDKPINPVFMKLSLEDVRPEDYKEKFCLSPKEFLTRD